VVWQRLPGLGRRRLRLRVERLPVDLELVGVRHRVVLRHVLAGLNAGGEARHRGDAAHERCDPAHGVPPGQNSNRTPSWNSRPGVGSTVWPIVAPKKVLTCSGFARFKRLNTSPSTVTRFRPVSVNVLARRRSSSAKRSVSNSPFFVVMSRLSRFPSPSLSTGKPAALKGRPLVERNTPLTSMAAGA